MAHWIDRAKPIPDVAKTHFHRYQKIRAAWERCNNGAYLVYLAKAFGTDVDRTHLGIAVSEATSMLRNALDAHYRSKKTRDPEDPLARAYRDVISDIELALADTTGFRPSRPNNFSTSYESYRDDALRAVADLLRARLDAPENDLAA